MNYKNYIKNNKLILPKGFNSPLNCAYNNLNELILPEGFNSDLFCSYNNLSELILPKRFRGKYSPLYCNNKQLIINHLANLHSVIRIVSKFNIVKLNIYSISSIFKFIYYFF